MRVIIAECSAIYSGRGDSTLARGTRAILIKSDGSVSIHNDNSNKPLNYMKTASQIVTVNSDGEEVWSFDARHELLQITIHRIHSGFEEQLLDKATEPGLKLDGTEAQLQQWLFAHPESLGSGVVTLQREFQTGAGAVDILAVGSDGLPLAVEVKRVAAAGAADQVRRYVENMRALEPIEFLHPETGEVYPLDFSQTTGLIAALDLRPKLLDLAQKRGLPTVTVPAYWRSGSVPRQVSSAE